MKTKTYNLTNLKSEQEQKQPLNLKSENEKLYFSKIVQEYSFKNNQ